MKNITTAICLLLATLSVSADMSCSGGFCVGIPDRLFVQINGDIRVFPIKDSGLIENLTCKPLLSGNALNLGEGDGRNDIKELIQESILHQKQIAIRLPDDETSNCDIQYVRLHNQDIRYP